MAANLSLYQVTSVIWAVVSDGKQAYGFKYRKDETVFKDNIYVLHGGKPEQEAAQSGEPAQKAEPSPKVTNKIVKNFIPTIASQLEQAFDANAFDYVVIVAPRKTLESLRDCLTERMRNRVLMNMPDGYVYDRSGAIFALKDEASDHFTSYTDTICRSLPPCCTRENGSREGGGVRIKRYRSGSTGYAGDTDIYIVQ